jgi:hypothetical protein
MRPDAAKLPGGADDKDRARTWRASSQSSGTIPQPIGCASSTTRIISPIWTRTRIGSCSPAGCGPGPGEWFCGGLWVLEVADRDEAVRLVEGDPYFMLGLRRSYELFVWGKAPCYGAVTL